MKKSFLVLFLLSLLAVCSINGQNYLWHSILSKGSYTQVEDAHEGVFIVSDGSLFFVNKKDFPNKGAEIAEVSSLLLDRKMGLSDSQIVAIRYSSATSSLIIYYQSGNIDILTMEGEVLNVPAIYENLRLTDKTIARIIPNGDKAYMVGGFGISTMDLKRGVINATYFIGKKVLSLSYKEELLYALLPQNKLYLGSEKNNLQDPSNWKLISLPIAGAEATSLALNGEEFLILDNKGRLYTTPVADLEGETLSLRLIKEQVTALRTSQDGILIVADKELALRNKEQKERLLTVAPSTIWSVSNNTVREHLWYNTSYSVSALSSVDEETSVIQSFHLDKNAPWDNNYYYSLFTNGRFYAVGGGRGSDRRWLPGTIKIFENNRWTNITPEEVTPASNSYFNDIVSIAIDPTDKNHYIVSSWGEGMFEFRNDAYVAHYSSHNTPLLSALPDEDYADHYVRVSSLAFDKKGGLWMAQGSVRENILYRTKEGDWYKYYHPTLIDVNSFGITLPMSNGDVWITIARRGDAQKGVLVLNNGGTLDNTADDKMLYIPQFIDRAGKSIATQSIFTLVQDKNGQLWLGTDKGPLVVANPLGVLRNLNNAPIASRPVGGKEPNLFYVLDNIPIVAIEVDNINNKWVGTDGDGLYLLSADGTEILQHFTTSNSPLLSDQIRTLSLDPNSGLLYITTPVGLMTYQTGNQESTKESMTEIHVYPNPVRPEDTDKVTITGLAVGMEIKVTDTYGNLLYTSTATGTEVSFAARRASGERFSSGVYVVMVYDPKSQNSELVRFAVIE
ncbi:type IX secretion system anionic LPS delivery protein PorZ [Porphyromonas circumdentaria]|uniref:Por secretion system C-terminal sorting domain-containing protein n=1 Tax=Porphyromonas circumdentaria TaxID=29524 RepID=A0A1T4MHY1_9PORP|nr:two-component regulator propeller domain-containing protein [Porphyromonas circumdentaria]MBB6275748.1 hypothetical protein [Porphyromonas circumdentaria]MDO4721746.1 two-component regulator propeller domain-containing protein [Porphyromonas circumdentaria]SJZ66471.1 Por secretion system C-terminal sorting domain-containing protein [Porphyromonas circumdentaria]